MAFDDPIVFPGQPGASHLHIFFGNTSTNAGSTNESLLAAKSSTCAGGIANLSSYWEPAIVDTITNRGLIPSEQLIYYKTGYNSVPHDQIQVPPNGLRVVAGNKATESNEVSPWGQLHHNFECWSDQIPNGRGGQIQNIPDCPVGGHIIVILDFPNCWDGVNLDSPDHRSHMAYSGGGACPASHPVAISNHLPEHHVPGDQRAGHQEMATGFRQLRHVQTGGYSMHGDIWVNWQKDVSEAWTMNCVRINKDCHAYLLGDGRTTF